MNRVIGRAPIVALLLAVIAAASLLNRSSAGKFPSDVPVTSTIDGLGVDTLPTMRVQSDQLGAY